MTEQAPTSGGFSFSSETGPRFKAIIAFEGMSTGDGRHIGLNAITWPDHEITLRVVMSDVGEHQGAQAVGVFTRIWREEDGDTNSIHAEGHFDTSEVAMEAARLAASRVKPGLSIDPDSVTGEPLLLDVDGQEVDISSFIDPEELYAEVDRVVADGGQVLDRYTSMRIRAVTLVDTPAFSDAKITEVEGVSFSSASSITAAAIQERVGGMIALIPSEEDRARLALSSGNPADELHVTLFTLGETITETLTEEVARAAEGIPIQDMRLWATAAFNPDGSDGRTPAHAYLVEGEGLASVRQLVEPLPADIPEQFNPWIPHMTIAQPSEDDLATLDQVGTDVTMDRLAVVLADEWTYFDLVGEDEVVDGVEDSENPESNQPDQPDQPDQDTPPPFTASAIPPHTTTVRPKGDGWDGTAMEQLLPTGEQPDFYARFYAYMANVGRDGNDQDGTAKDHWHYLHHYVEGQGTDAIVGDASTKACIAIIQLLNGARGVDIVAEGTDRQVVYDHVVKHLSDGGYEDIPELLSEEQAQEGTDMATETAHLDVTTKEVPCEDFMAANVTAAGITIPTVPTAHFEPMDFTAQTPLTISESGHVYGHVANGKICHVGLPKCVTMPKSQSSLRYFHTGNVRLDDGHDLAAGHITIKGGHAPLEMSWSEAVAHYDDVSTVFADVIAWEDEHGIAVTGHVRPGINPDLVQAAYGAVPSGDWRGIGNSAELINVHFTNSGGLPIFRIEDDRLVASVAASAAPVRRENPPTTTTIHPNEISPIIASAIDAALTIRELDEAMASNADELDERARATVDTITLD